LHAVRDPVGARGRVRRISGARVLLTRLPPIGEWWRSHFDEQYLREYQPLFDPERDRREVTRLIELLQLPVGSRILDCPCGQGRHAHLLAEHGYAVDGADLSRTLLAHARSRGTGRLLRYTRADMRALPRAWTGRFDAVLNLFTSFGFFTDPRDDVRVIREFARVLRPSGLLVWHGANLVRLLHRSARRRSRHPGIRSRPASVGAARVARRES
jgi:SAM-dependent methyltransferase